MHARTLLFTALIATFARSATWAAERQTEPDFVRDVQPILTAHCIACHGPDKQENGLRLDSGGGVMWGGDSGPAVVWGRAADSVRRQAGWGREETGVGVAR